LDQDHPPFLAAADLIDVPVEAVPLIAAVVASEIDRPSSERNAVGVIVRA
jgi:hypothetical protein